MKILLLSHNIKGRGTYLRFEGFARGLSQRGHQVTLVAARSNCLEFRFRAPSDDRWARDTCYLMTRRVAGGGLDPADLAQRLLMVIRQPFDMVHASEHRPAASLPALMARTRGSKVISDWADLWGTSGIMEGRHWAQRALLRTIETASERAFHLHADGVTTISGNLATKCTSLGRTPDTVQVIRNGIDTQTFRPVSDPQAIRRELHLPGTGPLLAFAGQADIDTDLLIGTFREVHRVRPDSHLLILGGAPVRWDDDDRLRRSIIERGWIPEAEFSLSLACADILLLPYRNTPRNLGRWPGKVAPYLAVGRPVVGNPTGDMKDLFDRGVGLAAPESARRMADRVLELLGSPGQMDACGARARQIAIDRFDLNIVAGELESFYLRILGGS